jgi:hypothetical protein
MKTSLLLALSLLTWASLLHGAGPGKSQSLTSPDQVPEGLQKSDWASIRAAHTAWEHSFMPLEGGGFQARNAGQQWTTQFDGRGFLAKPKAAEWQWGLELRSYGFGQKQREVKGRPTLKADGQRLSYQWDADVQEWFVNDKRGLEHGFTLARRPEGAMGALDVVLGTRGTLKPSVAADAQTVHFRDALGAPIVTYAGLKVWDADGQVLPSRFLAGPEGGIILRVQESTARYPLTIDPIAQQAYIKPSAESLGHAGAGDSFGCSVAVSGNTVVVGAFQEDSGTTGINSTPIDVAGLSGAAFVFVRSGSTWSQQAYLKASQVTADDYFGTSVAVSGDTVVVGAYNEDSSTTGINSTPNEGALNSGATYVFVRSGVTWSQQAYLKASQVSVNDYFGWSVAVSGDTVVVGAYLEDSSSPGINSTPDELSDGAGAAYVFVRSVITWSQQAHLKASQVSAFDQFGYSVAVSGDTLVVGAPQEDSSTTGINHTPNEGTFDAGAAYVLVRNGAMWSQQAYVKPTAESLGHAGRDDRFGSSVAVSGDTVVVGAFLENSSTTGINSMPDELLSGAGAAYVFVRSGTVWSQQAYLKAAQVTGGEGFGFSVAVSGDTVVVGAPYEASSTTGINSTPNEGANFAGAAYVFVRSGVTWSQQAYLKASEVTEYDEFGISVAVSGDTLVVGARGEDSSTAGINSTPNEGASLAGAAYVFVRSGVTWSQQAYLKASQVTAHDYFGYSVAVDGNTVAVGAYQEDSSTAGINSTPNELASSAGAAYVFVRSGVTWSQQAYLKAGQVSGADNFGYSVAVDGNTVVVGAYQEDSSTAGINSTPNEGAFNAGAAYVFVRSGVTWSQQAYLKASQVSGADQFGYSVAVDGDTVVVGSYQEDSSTTGINSTPDELASAAGAAYVFVRSGVTWSQQAYLKARQVSVDDNFGWSVAVSGGTVVVGVYGEDGGAPGINRMPDEGTMNAGAAYVFTGLGPVLDADTYGLLDSWELTYWPTTTGRGPLDDDDKDGYVELLELAFGLNPTLPNPGGLPALTEEGGYLTMTITKQPGASYEIQSAATLPGPFSAASTTVLINNSTTLKVRDNVLIGTPPARFMRVQVTAAP